MEITFSRQPATAVAADVAVVALYAGERPDRTPLKEIDAALGGALGAAIERGELSGKDGEMDWWPGTGLGAGRVLMAGAGKRAEFDADKARRLAGAAARAVRAKYGRVALLLRNDAHAEASVEGFLLGDFEPDLYRSERQEGKVGALVLVAGSKGDRTADHALRQAIETGRVLAESTNLARTLVTEPPNELTPLLLARRAVEELTPLGVAVDVIEGEDLARFGGLLGVAKGSDEPPALISMRWEPSRAKKSAPVLGLVGKGITFDSGGLSLKPNEGMEWMKGDMAGAAAVICAMRAIAALKLPVRVRAAVPTTENMPSGKATRVGDVLRAWSGKTIEVLNTDAEGRLVLADALAWLADQGVTYIVDVATLTGAVEIALGKVAFGVMGRPDGFVDRVLRASRKAGERAWPLPLYPEYREQISSPVADLKNVGGRPAGTITAAWFLSEFVPDTVGWAHLDIAGVAWGDGKPHLAKGATGAGVRALVRLAQDVAAKS